MSTQRRVLIITYYWPPSGGAGVQRWLKLSKYLCEAGVECTILTVDPEQASYPVQDNSLLADIHPGLRIIHTRTKEPFGLYKKLTRRNTIPYAGFANEDTSFKKKIARFIRGNFFIPDARKGWNTFVLKESIKLLSKEKYDGVIISTPPHSTQMVGLALKKRFPIHWIADMRDPWTDIYYYKSMLHTAWARRKDAALEKKVLLTADQVVVVSESIRRLFIAKGIAAEKIHVIPNGFDPADFSRESEAPTEKRETLHITYTGTLSESYPIAGLIAALRQIQVPISLKFVGDVAPALRTQLSEFKVEYTGYLSHDQSIAAIQDSDVLLLIIPDVENNSGILTGKLFEYLAARKPILAFGPVSGDAAKIIESCGSGKMYPYDNSAGAADFITSCAQGAKTAPVGDWTEINAFSREAQAAQFLDLLS